MNMLTLFSSNIPHKVATPANDSYSRFVYYGRKLIYRF